MSREAIRYTPNTIKFLKKRFKEAVDEATQIIEKKLDQDDFVDWLENCTKIINSYSNNDVFSKIVDIVDKSSISPKYKKDRTVKYQPVSAMAPALLLRNATLRTKYNQKTGLTTKKVERTRLTDWLGVDFDCIYLKKGKSDPVKDMYLRDGRAFVYTIEWATDETLMAIAKDSIPDGENPHDWIKKAKKQSQKVWDYLKTSKRAKNYDSVVVPSHEVKRITELLKDDTTDSTNVVDKNTLSPKEFRKKHKLTLAYCFDSNGDSGSEYTKKEFSEDMLDKYQGRLYYGVKDDMQKMSEISCYVQWATTDKKLFYDVTGVHDGVDNPEWGLTLLRVAKSRVKLYEDKFYHYSKFFNEAEELDESGCFTIDPAAIKTATAEYIKPVKTYSFLHNWRFIQPIIESHYRDCVSYIKKYGTLVDTPEHLKKWIKLQMKLYYSDNATKTLEGLKQNPDYEWIPEGLKSVKVVDGLVCQVADELIQYATPLNPLMKHMPHYKSNIYKISAHFDKEEIKLINQLVKINKCEYTEYDINFEDR